MSAPLKILFLAMDAGDKFLIRQWAADGTLPVLKALLAQGLVGDTLSLEGFYEGSTWPSFYTGVSPARHGFHSLTQLRPGTYEFYHRYPGEGMTPKPFWDYLSAAGRRVAILDIPLAAISRGLNGIHLVEWASHDGVYGFQTWPAGLKWEVWARFGRHPVRRSCDSYRRSREDFALFKRHLLKGVQRKKELTLHYLKKGRWDFFAQVFSECHCVGHQCWHLHDPAHPAYDPELARYLGDPVREVYQAVDGALGEILAQADDNTLIFFLASHRMSHAFGGYFLLAEILRKLHLTGRRPGGAGPGQTPGQARNAYDFLVQQWQRVPPGVKRVCEPPLLALRERLADLLKGKDRLDLPGYLRNIDLKNSKCFPVLNGHTVSGIRINLAGREPRGVVAPGREFDDLCREISADLLDIVDLDTGAPLIKSVQQTGKLYAGAELDQLPDLLVAWNDVKPLGNTNLHGGRGSKLRLASAKFGVIEGTNAYVRTGDHRPEGLFLARGPGLQAGRLDRTVSIMDFAPTFMALLDAQGPEVEGQPIREILPVRR